LLDEALATVARLPDEQQDQFARILLQHAVLNYMKTRSPGGADHVLSRIEVALSVVADQPRVDM
jgi:hypothetical protein